MSMFINRKEELEKLKEIFGSKSAELVLVYGRRRVGKSTLLLQTITGKRDAVYFLADRSKNILEVLAKQIGDEFVRFSTWDDFFEFIYKSRYTIFIIDEFQYLYDIDKAWLTILQRWWEKIKNTNKKVILCGSVISTIYKIAQGYGSALYGRKTFEFEIKPLAFNHIKNFFNYSIEDLIVAYSILGGIPRYLEEFDRHKSLKENIKYKLLDKRGFLYNEPMNLLYEEFRDATPYISILLAVSQGYTRFNDISTASRIESHKLPKYLGILERVGIIEKEAPITEKKIKGKITRYKVVDNFYKFWFRFVFKNKSQIEQGLQDDVFNTIYEELNMYVGYTFEDICKDFLLNSKKRSFKKIGKWWHKDKEIDVVGLNETTKEILLAECKWKDNVNAEIILKDLKEKAKYIEWHNKDRKESFVIFSKSFKKIVNEKNVSCFDLQDIKKSIILKN